MADPREEWYADRLPIALSNPLWVFNIGNIRANFSCLALDSGLNFISPESMTVRYWRFFPAPEQL